MLDMDFNVDEFLRAAEDGWMSKVRRFISEGMDVNARNHRGETALMAAADAKQTDVVSFLLDCGADVNVIDNQNWTAIQEAAQVNAVSIVQMLLAHGADITTKNDLGWDLLFIAKNNKNQALIELIEEYSRSQ
jgi:ankyrin repeat protein